MGSGGVGSVAWPEVKNSFILDISLPCPLSWLGAIPLFLKVPSLDFFPFFLRRRRKNGRGGEKLHFAPSFSATFPLSPSSSLCSLFLLFLVLHKLDRLYLST